MSRAERRASLAPQRFDQLDGFLGFGLRLLFARLGQRELGIGLRPHEDELGALVVPVLHELLRLLHLFLGQLHRERRGRHASGAYLLRSADARLRGSNAFRGRWVASTSGQKKCTHDETRKLSHAILVGYLRSGETVLGSGGEFYVTAQPFVNSP